MSDISNILIPVSEGYQEIALQSHTVTQSNIVTLDKVTNTSANTGELRENLLPAMPDIAPRPYTPQLAQHIETINNIDDEPSASYSGGSAEKAMSAQEIKLFLPSLADLSQLHLKPDSSQTDTAKNLTAFLRERHLTVPGSNAALTVDKLVQITELPDVQKALTVKQIEKINKSEPQDFALLLSCVTQYPVIFLTPTDKKTSSPKHAYHHGEALTNKLLLDDFDEAIVFTKSKHEMVLTIKNPGTKNIVKKIPVNNYVEMIQNIPKNLYRFSQYEQVCLFMSVPASVFKMQGKNLYHELKSAVVNHDTPLIHKLYREVSIFDSALTGGIARDSFYQQLFDDINKKANNTGKMIAFISRHLYVLPAEEMKVMTEGILYKKPRQPADTDNLSAYLCALAEKLPRSRKQDLLTAIETVVKGISRDIKSYVELMEKSKRILLDVLDTRRLEDETTRENLRYYYDQFLAAIKNTGLPDIYSQIAIEQLFLLRGYVDDNFAEKLLPVVREALKSNLAIIKSVCENPSPDICSLDDRALSLLIINAYLLPPSTASFLIPHFSKMLSRLGTAGNIPLSACHLIDYLNVFDSTVASKVLFDKTFYTFVKKEKRQNGLTMLFSINACSKESEIYNYSPSDTVKMFKIVWDMFQLVCYHPIRDDQCLVIQNDRAYLDLKEKWSEMLDTTKVNLTVMSKISVQKWVEKCKYLESEVFRHQDAASLFKVILQSLSSHRNRTNITQKVIATHLTGEKWNRAQQATKLNQYLNTLVQIPRNDDVQKTTYTNIVLGVTDIQIGLLTGILSEPAHNANNAISDAREEIIDSMASNIELIDKAAEVKRIIELFRNRLESGELKHSEYQTIISNIITTSLARNIAKEGRIFRSLILNSALTEMDKVKKLDNFFLLLSALRTSRSFTDTGFNIFYPLLKCEILPATPSPLKDNRSMSAAEREAFSKFITAQSVNFTLLDNAGIDLSDRMINTSWIINSTTFFEAPAEVQHAMLQFIRTVLQEDPINFIGQSLTLLDQQLTEIPSVKIKNMAKSINAICNFFRQTPPADVPLIVSKFTGLYLKLQQHDNLQDIFPSVQNSLKAMLKEFTRLQRISTEILPEQLQPLVIAEKTADTFTINFLEESQKHTTSSASDSEARTLKRRNLPDREETPPSDISSASVRVKQRPASKPVTARTLFCNKALETLHDDPDVISALKNSLRLFLSDASAAQLNLHAYKHRSRQSRFYTFDIKMSDQSWKGRSDHRAIVLKGSDNRYFLSGIATHDELKTPSLTHLKLTVKQVDEQFFQATDKQLWINPQTQQPEWMPPADNPPA